MAAEALLLSSKVVNALSAEIRAMSKLVDANVQTVQSIRSAEAQSAAQERQLRHNLQEDARQALGNLLILESDFAHMHDLWPTGNCHPFSKTVNRPILIKE